MFVTGIGQSQTYLLDERVAGFEVPTFDTYAPLIESGEYLANRNLFNDMEARLKEPEAPEENQNALTDALNQSLKDSNDTVNRIFGAKGFWDRPLSLR